jgi:ATP-dependent helicase/nuclease subunit A
LGTYEKRSRERRESIMGEAKWTKEQELAIKTRYSNLLVAAAAGSGKTAVLVERIIRIITNEEKPVDIDRLLVVTFTNAAAAEMRERIGDAIAKNLDKNPESKVLQRQLTLLNKASITTMHSFCLDIIRNNFHKIDLDPNFRIADSTEEVLLKSETIDELFEERYAEVEAYEKHTFLDLVEAYGGGRDDTKLKDIVLNLFRFSMSGPFPKRWIKEAVEAFNVDETFDFGATRWAKVIKDSAKVELQGAKGIIYKAIELTKTSEALAPYLDTFNEDLKIIDSLLVSLDYSWGTIQDEFLSYKFPTIKRLSKNAVYDEELQKKVKDKLRKSAKDKVDKVKKEIFGLDMELVKANLKELYPMMKELGALVIGFNELYTLKKRERGLLDFNDLEHLALKILIHEDENGKAQPTDTALMLREHFDEVLVDEYQDSNLVQEVIIDMVSRKLTDNPNVFMVGDIKQSIYRFRQAVPGLFLDKYENYGREEGVKNRVITLYKNFRSRKEIIEGVNFIFKLLMSKEVGELEYTEEEALNLGADYKELTEESSFAGGNVELHIIEKKEAVSDKNSEEELEEASDVELDNAEEESLDNIQVEARVAAKRIKELMSRSEGKSFKVFDKKKESYRKVQFRDIVILLRATKDYAPIFVEEFSKQGIPVYADTGTGYFETIEIRTMMSLLQIIDNPLQDIPLIAVLRSPIYGFTPEELIDMRLTDEKIPFYKAVKRFADNEQEQAESSAYRKARKFLKELEVYRNKSLHMPIDELIWYLFSETGYYGYAGAMPGGVQRQANLRILFERARQFENTSYRGLFNFVNFIDKLRTNSGDMGSAKILGENEDVVRIMSIHKSKGLEFPVVLLCASGKNFNLRDLNNKILYHKDLGLGPEYVNPEKRIEHSTIVKMALRNKMKLETLSEEMRILYVAFTRAKEKLIITGMINDVEKTVKKWWDSLEKDKIKIPEYAALNSKSYMDWIGLALLKHKQGDILRDLAGVDSYNLGTLAEDESQWEVSLWNKNDVVLKVDEAQEEEEIETISFENLQGQAKEQGESQYKAEIERRLSWEYKYKEASNIPAKLSVTELKRLAFNPANDEYTTNMFTSRLLKKPSFLEEEKGLTAAERGTVIHFVMQHLDLKRVKNSQEISEQVKEMLLKELLTEEQAMAVNIKAISRFFSSAIGRRLLSSKDIQREVAFHMKLKGTEVKKELPEEVYGQEETLLMGVIDCFFYEENGIVLIDYKTDFATDENMQEIKERYEKQIYYYTEALNRITGEKVKEKYIYLFGNGKIIEY